MTQYSPTYRFYFTGLGISILFILGYTFPICINIAFGILILLLLISGLETYYLSQIIQKLKIKRILQDRYALGDEQLIQYDLSLDLINRSIHLVIWDNMDEKIEQRKPIYKTRLHAGQEVSPFYYKWMPIDRGIHLFYGLVAEAQFQMLGLVKARRHYSQEEKTIVLPSFIQQRKYELQVFGKMATLAGVRRVRQLGENDEFESIRPYNMGDNIRSINWKAVSRSRTLMVNQYQNTRAQAVYCIIDKGRSMKMPFNGLTLLDHAINATLVLSSIVLRKYDKAGVITFDTSLDPILKAEQSDRQIEYISRFLADQKTNFLDANYEKLFYTIRRLISKRSVLFFFCNFDLMVDLERNVDYLANMNKRHLMVVILFINSELELAGEGISVEKKDIYIKTMIKDALLEKERIAQRLRAIGVQVILTRPEHLSINIINKYLAIKARNMK